MIILWANEKLSHVKASKLIKCRSVKSIKISPFLSVYLKTPKFVLLVHTISHPSHRLKIAVNLTYSSFIQNFELSFEAKYHIELLKFSVCLKIEEWNHLARKMTWHFFPWNNRESCVVAHDSNPQHLTDRWAGDQKSKAIPSYRHLDVSLDTCVLVSKHFQLDTWSFVVFFF